MTAVVRMAVLDVRTVAPYRYQGIGVFGLGVLLFATRPVVFVLALVLFFTSQYAAYPFNVADKAGLETLYAVLPLHRRSVLYGHYVWALALYISTVAVGAPLALFFAWAQDVPFDGRTLVSVLTLSWAVFAVNTAVQFPLLVRYGYSRVNVLATALPLALVVGVLYRTNLAMPSTWAWLPLVWVAGAAAIAASTAVAGHADRRRTGFR